MVGFLRLLFGIVLLPACIALTLTLTDAILLSANASGGFSAETISLLGGLVAFVVLWVALPHPVKTYVVGHELTHALWGILFGAKARDVRVSEKGGSVKLSKTNLIITLAPYFFPFYTFLVILVALFTYIFVRPLPWLPLWMFFIGFTWAFHALFTIETLTHRQPDVALYGRIFSWTFIFLVNIAVVLVWLAAMTQLTFKQLWTVLLARNSSIYGTVWQLGRDIVSHIMG